eukprot:4332180-Prymnesium_polylepis.1
MSRRHAAGGVDRVAPATGRSQVIVPQRRARSIVGGDRRDDTHPTPRCVETGVPTLPREPSPVRRDR